MHAKLRLQAKTGLKYLGRENGFFLTDGVEHGSKRDQRDLPLNRFPTLYRIFAYTEPSKEGILAFADTYGLLLKSNGPPFIGYTAPGQEPIVVHGEPLATWQRQILMMRQVISVWDLARNNEGQGLARIFQWTQSDQISYQSGDALQHSVGPVSPENDPDYDWDLPKEFRFTDHGIEELNLSGSPEPTMHVAESVSSASIQRQKTEERTLVEPAMYWVLQVVNRYIRPEVAPQLVWDPKLRQPTLRVVPKSLLGALWLQFAQAIDQGTNYEQCKSCRTWFVLSPGLQKREKKFCGTPCRVQAYRKRQLEARRLYDEGVPVKNISRRLGTDPSTAKRWITAEGQSRRQAPRQRRR